jgi:putative spermidine/putrescine transport system permease protein
MWLNAAMTPRLRLIAMLAPALTVVVVLFGGGLALAVLHSLGWFPAIGQTTFTRNAYRAVFADGAFWASLALTLWIAFASTALSAVLAVAAALLLRPAFRGKRPLTFLFQLNLPIPHSVGAVGMLLLLSQSGLLARLAYAARLIESPADFPALVFDPLAVGIIAEYVWKTSVFIGVIVLAALQTVGDDYEGAARSLGADAWQRFRFVTLPLIRPALLSASILVFAFTFGAFEVPVLLGQRFPSALPVLAYRDYVSTDLNTRPEAMALSVVIAALSAGLIGIYMRVARK